MLASGQEPLQRFRQLAQQEARDSLFYIHLYETAKTSYKVQPDTTLHYLNTYLHQIEDTSLFRGVGLSHILKGIIHKDQGKYDEAIHTYQKALTYLEPIGYDLAIAAVYNNLGTAYKRKTLYRKALKAYFQSINIKQELHGKTELTSTYNNIGLVYFHLGEFDKAARYYLRNIQICKRHHLGNKLAKNYNNLGNVRLKQQRYQEALDDYRQALEHLEPETNLFLKARILNNTGIAHRLLKKPTQAMTYHQNALTLMRRLGDIQQVINTLQKLGKAYQFSNRTNRAEAYYQEAYQLAKEHGDLFYLKEVAFNIYKLAKQQGDFQKSLTYSEAYIRYKDSILNIEKNKEIERLKAKFESEQKAQRIELLKKENQVQELELEKEREEKARKQLQAAILVGVVGVTLGFVVFLFSLIRKKKRIHQVLQEQYAQIQEQKEEIRTQNERLASANELKDQMFQIIAHDLRSPLIAMDDVARLIPYAIEEKDHNSLQELSHSLQNSVSRILELTDNLLSWSMSHNDEITYQPENTSIYEIGERTLEIYFALARMKKIHLMNNIDQGVYAHADKNLLMTVLRNLVNNALKFTPEDGMVVIGASTNEEVVHVWVQDTGIGMKPERVETIFNLEKTKSAGTRGETGNGLGMFFCKKFVEINRGEIYVESEQGKGTKITFTLPNAESMVYS